MSAQAAREHPEPLVIFRSVNRDGETYALEPRSLERLREAFGAAVHSRSRVFIAHETKADYEHVHGTVAKQIIQLLTGLDEGRLDALGGVTFRDALTEMDLERT